MNAAEIVRIPDSLALSGASRLVSDAAGDRERAGKRFVSLAPAHGIDLSLMWGTVTPGAGGRPAQVRQVCLAVRGAGGTALLFASGPAEGTREESEGDRAERAAAVRAACGFLSAEAGHATRIAQALPEPGEDWLIRAFLDAGFLRVGDLAYLRRPLHPPARNKERAPAPTWPAGITVRNVRGVDPGQTDHALLVEALDRSYEATLDCPELCGLRRTEDVIVSHRATGVWSPNLWWLVLHEGQAMGCVLLNKCPEQDSVELVYIGVAPSVRGTGVGRRLLDMAIGAAERQGLSKLTCALDRRNTPAARLYERTGFSEFAQRVALVKPL